MSDFLIPMVQSEIPFVAGSPEGRLKAPVGWLAADGITGKHYEKRSGADLSTGWVVMASTGTLPFDWTTGAGEPNGVVSGNKGDHYTQVVGPDEAYEWIKTTDGGDTGWV